MKYVQQRNNIPKFTISPISTLISISILALCVTGIVWFTGCTTGKNAPGAKEKLSFWLPGMNWHTKAIVQLTNEFNKTQTNFEIDPQYISSADIETKYLVASAGQGDLPDIIYWNRPMLASLAARNGAMDLTPFLKNSSIKPADFFKACWDETLWDGKSFAIPHNTDLRILFYNKDLFRKAGLDPNKPPKTWKDLVAYSDKLTIKDPKTGNIKQLGFLPIFQTTGNSHLFLYAYQKGGTFLSPDGRKATCNSPGTVAALQWIIAFNNRYGRDKIIRLQSGFSGVGNEAMHPFLLGQVAMITEGDYFVKIIEQNKKMDYGVCQVPYPEDGHPATWSGGFCFVISPTSKHAEEAWKYIEYMSSEPIQVKFAELTRLMPANEKAARNEELMKNPNHKVAVEAMAHSHFLPHTPIFRYYWNQIMQLQEKSFYFSDPKQAKPALDEVAANVQKELDNFYKNYNSKPE